MAIIRALIVDDEPLARKYLRSILEEMDGVEVVGEAGSWSECSRLADELRPNTVFLDIRMPEVSGLDAAERLSRDSLPPFVVFVTGYDEYAVSAFEASATDYILKPFDAARVEKAVSKVRRALADRELAARQGELAGEPEEPQASGSLDLDRLPIRVDGNIRLLDPSQISYIHCEAKKVLIHAGQREYKTNLTLTQLEQRLSNRRFFRANEGCLVNMEKVREINYLGDENYELVLNDKEETIIPLSRSRARMLRKMLGW